MVVHTQPYEIWSSKNIPTVSKTNNFILQLCDDNELLRCMMNLPVVYIYLCFAAETDVHVSIVDCEIAILNEKMRCDVESDEDTPSHEYLLLPVYSTQFVPPCTTP